MQFMDAAFVSDVKETYTDAGLPVYFVDGSRRECLMENIRAGFGRISWRRDHAADIAKTKWLILPHSTAGFVHIRYYHYIKEDGMQIYMLVNEERKFTRVKLICAGKKKDNFCLCMMHGSKNLRSDDKDEKSA